jgi:tetraacyldisaccharide 4'-kinase
MVDPSGHTAADVGDEPLMLAFHVPVVVARERVDGATFAKSRRASVILMDDGFQNPALAKDAALIVIDSERGIGNGCVFPAGPLRAPLPAQIARTDALVVIGKGHAAKEVAAAVAAPGKPVFAACLQPDPAAVERLRGKRVLAFAGIGDPDRFFRTLRASGIDVAQHKAFADHHVFSAHEIGLLAESAKREGLTLVTTEKDLVRLRGDAQVFPFSQAIVPFPVTLHFADVARLRKFLSDRLFEARDKRLRA